MQLSISKIEITPISTDASISLDQRIVSIGLSTLLNVVQTFGEKRLLDMELILQICCICLVITLASSASVSPHADPELTPAPTPYPTHPMDDPEWAPPVGPRQELDKQYWIRTGQRLLDEQLSKNQLNLNVAKNVVIFIGDGMSIATQTATRMYMGGEELTLSFEQFPYVGLAKVSDWSADGSL